MNNNFFYTSPGRGPSPAELEKDSDFAECAGCGEWPGHCPCEDGFAGILKEG